jgi:hypothetical protein
MKERELVYGGEGVWRGGLGGVGGGDVCAQNESELCVRPVS